MSVTEDRGGTTHHLDVEVEQLRTRLRALPDASDAPTSDRGWQAATAIVLAPHERTPAIAFIRRTERPHDRWSGHMALPGGRRDRDDRNLAETAMRETAEEIGVHLGPPVARLPDQGGRSTPMTVATYVHVLDHRPALIPEPREVAEALWIPLHRLVAPEAATRHRRRGIPFPAIDHEGRIIWGLTHRILGTFLDAIGMALPEPRRR